MSMEEAMKMERWAHGVHGAWGMKLRSMQAGLSFEIGLQAGVKTGNEGSSAMIISTSAIFYCDGWGGDDVMDHER
jgi:hypothetical protein